MKKKVLFIVNPISGSGKNKKIEEDIKKYLLHDVFDYEICYTERAGHATELTRQAVAQKVDIVVAVGGDGTINEVARSVIHTPTALGIIPRGSGNGLARHLLIPVNTQKALEILNRHMVRCLDYGIINGHPFFCTCGVGFDAFVSHKFAEAGRRGFFSYAENTLREGIRYKPETYIIEDETGSIIHKAFLIACANASQYGNNAYIAPHASMEDGLMDIVVMKPFNTLIESPMVLLQMFTKQLEENPHVEFLKSRKIRIIREREGAVHLDGEPLVMGKEISVEMISGNFNVVINPKALSNKVNSLTMFVDSFNELLKKMDSQITKSMNDSEYRMKQSFNDLKRRMDEQLFGKNNSKKKVQQEHNTETKKEDE